MDINNLTKLAELFKQYPFLKDELVKYSDKFAAVVSQVNLEQVSQTSGLDVNTLIAKIKEIIAAHQA